MPKTSLAASCVPQFPVTACPKQFLPIVGDQPLITQTVERLCGTTAPETILVITNTAQLDGTRTRTPTLPSRNVIAEPLGRNTAPCVALAALLCQVRSQGDPVVGMFPADAHIEPADEFARTVSTAVELAASGETIVTIGIPPRWPATGPCSLRGTDARHHRRR